MSALKFVDSHNIVAFLAKPTKSEGFEQIVDFLNANPIKYMLTALVDGKKVIITETSVRRDLQLEDAEGIECIPNADIFEQLALMGKVFGNMKRVGKGFSGAVTPLFLTMMVQAQEEMGEGSDMPTDPHHTPIITQPSTSQPQKKQKTRKSKKQNTEVPQLSDSTDDVADENVPRHSNNPLLNGEDRLKLNELMELYTKLSDRVLDLEHTKTTQALKIESLKRRVKKLKKKKRSRTPVLKRLRKVGRSTRIESSKDEGLGDQEDASKQGRKIDDIDKDVEVTLIDETQGRFGEDLMFNTGVFDVEGVSAGQDMAEKEVSTADLVTIAGKLVTTADVAVSAWCVYF
ncbi:hypothetical protein Tco_0632578 [Tanacetum coccineum]